MSNAVRASVQPAAPPPTKHLKAVLYLKNVDELGPWHILLSKRAERDLREKRNGDFKMFKIVMKKLKELSFGEFSNDNQKRLTGQEIPIPIYEAKMTRDTRLVVSPL